ncbi:MAG: MFS transporter [Rhodanobacteraceae bacterium]
MNRLRDTVVWGLGAAQCVYWGILYYAYSVLLVPMSDTFAVPTGHIAGAFSLGLAVSALLAPAVGRRLDHGQGIVLLQWGAVAGGALLLAWSCVSSVTQLYAVWAGLGLCMALVLYETAFSLVTRAIDDPSQRLRALASVTVAGGLASSVFLPLVGTGVAALGWRATLQGLAIVWLLATVLLVRYTLPALRQAQRAIALAPTAAPAAVTARRAVWMTGAPFVVATFAAMAVTTVLVPHLVARGHSLAAASWVLAALGVMQLPGRLWLWRSGTLALSPRLLLVGSPVLQVAGLCVLAVASGVVGAAAGVALFGVGAGMHTLARPWIVPLRFGTAAAGQVNGAIARAQGAARAAGPFAAAWAADRVGGAPVFVVLALVLLVCLPLAWSAGAPASPPEQLPG